MFEQVRAKLAASHDVPAATHDQQMTTQQQQAVSDERQHIDQSIIRLAQALDGAATQHEAHAIDGGGYGGDAFTGVFFYGGAHGERPPDTDAALQIMQSEDRSRWIVFRDDSATCEQCAPPLDECAAAADDGTERTDSVPFCHRSFARAQPLDALAFAHRLLKTQRAASLSSALPDSATAYVVTYNLVAGSTQVSVVTSEVVSLLLPNEVPGSRRSLALSPTLSQSGTICSKSFCNVPIWLWATLGGLLLAAVVGVATYYLVQARRHKAKAGSVGDEPPTLRATSSTKQETATA